MFCLFYKKYQSSNAESESDDQWSSLVPLQAKRGQIVLVLESHTKQCLAFCHGSIGRIEKSLLKTVEGGSAPQCPTGSAQEDAKNLLNVFCLRDFRLVQLFLDVVPNSSASVFATFLLELLCQKETDSRALLQLLIRQEVKNTSEHQMLFRGNTVASKVLSQFAKHVGSKYLDVLLRPLIRSTLMMGHEVVDFVDFDPHAKHPRTPHSSRSVNLSREEPPNSAGEEVLIV
jgi:hypothetical protein